MRREIAQNQEITLCANCPGIQAEMDARADVKHEISFNRP